MIGFGVGVIFGILIGFYAGNPLFRRKVNAKLMKREEEDVKPRAADACIACGGAKLQTLNSGLQVQCPECKGTGLKQ